MRFKTAIVIYGGVSELGYIRTPKKLQEKEQLEALRQDISELQDKVILLKQQGQKSPEPNQTK